LTHDEQWIHIDVEKSKKHSPYKTTVAHGFYILSLGTKFVYETFNIKNVKMGVNYGLDRVRFMSPTLSGGYVRGRVSLLNAEYSPGTAKYKMSITFELKGQDKPVCVAEFLAMAYE
jgi:acyl dehydratase